METTPAVEMTTHMEDMPNQAVPVVCYMPTMVTSNGVWIGSNPVQFAFPLFMLQLTLVIAITRILNFILKPLRQPRVVAEIIAGVVLGPSGLGRSEKFSAFIFPLRSVTVLETIAYIGVLYFLFLVGLELDLSIIKQAGMKATVIALSGIVLPYMLGIILTMALNYCPVHSDIHLGGFILFLGISLSITAFPVLARILAELKLLNTELGRLAMSSAIVNDLCAWILLAMSIALMGEHGSVKASLWVILSSVAYVLFCIYTIRPAILWVIRRTPEGEPVKEFYVCMILVGVMLSSFITDAIGINCILGAFLFGLVIPNRPLGVALIEKLEDFITGLLLPVFFAISGLRTDLRATTHVSSWGLLVIIIIAASAGKVGTTTFVAFSYKMPLQEGISLGLLMNSKGLIEMIVLSIGREQKVIDDQTFAIMVIMSIIMTAMITPILTVIYLPARLGLANETKVKTARVDPNKGLHLLACIHSPDNVPAVINLIEASHSAQKSPISIFVLHLIELTGRATAMLVNHNMHKLGRPTSNGFRSKSNPIFNAFQTYEENTAGVEVQASTSMSPYSTMHEDICNLAQEKAIAMIITPFHMRQRVDGQMEVIKASHRTINQKILAHAPCSVGILVDRGLGGTSQFTACRISLKVVVLFFGGPDDREALAYAWRMVGSRGLKIKLVRFMEREREGQHEHPLTTTNDGERELQEDNALVANFLSMKDGDGAVEYMEVIASSGEETVLFLRKMDSDIDLCIVGRTHGRIAPLMGLTDWSECAELGAIGDLLASSDFSITISVLVVQQCKELTSPDTHDDHQPSHIQSQNSLGV